MTSILFEQRQRPKGPEPLACAFYSIVPGIGQLYNGKTKKGKDLHVQISLPPVVMVITTYEPDAEEWINFKIRR